MTQAFTGKVPFPEIGFSAVAAAIMNGDRPSRPDHPDLAEHLWILTKRCWMDSAEYRPDVGDAVKVIKQRSAYNLSEANFLLTLF